MRCGSPSTPSPQTRPAPLTSSSATTSSRARRWCRSQTACSRRSAPSRPNSGGVPRSRRRCCSRGPAATPTAAIRWRLTTLNRRLRRWLEACDLRDAQGRPVRITSHQFRHTLGTRLVNHEVPLETIRRLLDHDSLAMTAHYAQLKTRRCAASGSATRSGSTSAASSSRLIPTARSLMPPGPRRTSPAPSRRSPTGTADCRSSSAARTERLPNLRPLPHHRRVPAAPP